MKIKNKAVISFTISALAILFGLSSVSATESDWQNLNPSFQSGLSGNVNNCNPLTVSNGSVAAYPSCAITCNSGYSLSGSSCVVQGGGGGGGGGSAAPAPAVTQTIGSAGTTASISVGSTQAGSLTQSFVGESKLVLTVPQGAVSTLTVFTATTGELSPAMTPLSTGGAFMVGGQVFNVNATSNGVAVNNFSSNLTITLTVPSLPTDTSDLAVYYFNDTANNWVLVPGALFNISTHEVTFQVNHLTKFAVFNVTDQPNLIAVASPEQEVTEENGSVVSEDNTAFVTLEKSLVKKVNKTLAQRLSGRILLQVEGRGQAWFVNPLNGYKYFLGRPADAFAIMRKLGLGVSNKTFATFKNDKAPARLSGRILLKVEDLGKAYYVNPVDLKLHYLGRPADAFSVMRNLGLGITNENLRQISVSEIK